MSWLRSRFDKVVIAVRHRPRVLRVLRTTVVAAVLVMFCIAPWLFHISWAKYGAIVLGAAAVLSTFGTLLAAFASSQAAKETQRTANIMSAQWESDLQRQRNDAVTRRAGMLRALRLECKYVAEIWGNNIYARRELPRWEEWSTEVATYYPDLAIQLNEAATSVGIANSMIDLIDKFKENNPQRAAQFQAADMAMAMTAVALNDVVRHIDWITSGGLGLQTSNGQLSTPPTVRKVDLNIDRNTWSINKHLPGFPSEPTASPTTVKVYCELRKIVARYSTASVEFISTYRPLDSRWATDIEITTDTRPTGHAMDIIQFDLPNPDLPERGVEYKSGQGSL